MTLSTARRAWRAALLGTLAPLAACDVPSSPPIFQQTWIIPGDSAKVGVADLLPVGVTLGGGATPSFVVTTPTANVSTTLGALCGQPACQSAVTVSAPVPAFTSTSGALTNAVAFPSGVSSATVTGGTIALAITNNLGFDPLRPNGASAPFGRLIVAIASGTISRTDTILGSAALGIANGATTNLGITLPTGTYASSVSVAMTLVVPAGGTASLNASNGLAIATSLQNFVVSQVAVVLANRSVSPTPTSFDLSGADFGNQVEGGGLLLEILNPLTATGALNVVLSVPQQGSLPAVTIAKPVNIPAQTTTNATVLFTKAELQSLLGRTGVTITPSGSVTGTGPGNTVALTPTSEIRVRSRLQLTLNVGG